LIVSAGYSKVCIVLTNECFVNVFYSDGTPSARCTLLMSPDSWEALRMYMVGLLLTLLIAVMLMAPGAIPSMLKAALSTLGVGK
jgi:uncharacterized membrane protein